MGATHIVDRSVPLSDLSKAVNAITLEPVKIVYDAISSPETQNAAYDAVAPGGQIVIVLEDSIVKDKKLGSKEIAHVCGFAELPEQREVGGSLYAKLTQLLAAGDIKVRHDQLHPGHMH
jgi:threonine dehydrogenase-like Zn-dependent dehydrogenase